MWPGLFAMSCGLAAGSVVVARRRAVVVKAMVSSAAVVAGRVPHVDVRTEALL